MDTAVLYELESHFLGRSEAVRQLYGVLTAAVIKFGPVVQDPKKTSIHLNRRTAFAGIQTRQSHIILTVKSDVPIGSERIVKSQRTSANRWHCEFRLKEAADIDDELIDWLKRAYALSA